MSRSGSASRFERLRHVSVLLAFCALLSGATCVQNLRKTFPPGDSTHFKEQSVLLTRVNPHKIVVNEADAIFEPDFHYRLPNGVNVWAMLVAVRTEGNFAFQVTLQQPGKEPLNIKQFPGEKVVPSGTDNNPYELVRAELEQNGRLLTHLQQASGTPTWLMQTGSFDNRELYHLLFLIPERLIPDYKSDDVMNSTALLRIFNQAPQEDGAVKEFKAAELRLTKNAVLNVLSIGDSVMWGQGLKEEQKFTNLIAKSILEDTGIPVRVFRFAHSGAVVKESSGSCPEENGMNARHGEISRAEGQPEFASSRVPCQLERFARRIGNPKIHFVLANGCANDVGLNGLGSFILLPFQNRSEEYASMRAKCRNGMQALLSKIRATEALRSAPIVVTGYYSPLTFGSLGKKVELDERTDGLETLVRDYIIPEEPIDKSRDWKMSSDEGLQEAVTASGGRAAGIIFASIDDPGSESGIFARNPIAFDYRPSKIDDLFAFRGRICRDHGRDGDPFCLGAGIMHPNPDGARIYKTAIVDAMKSLGIYPQPVAGHTPPAAGQPRRWCAALKVTEDDAEREWIDAEKNATNSLFLLKAETVNPNCNE